MRGHPVGRRPSRWLVRMGWPVSAGRRPGRAGGLLAGLLAVVLVGACGSAGEPVRSSSTPPLRPPLPVDLQDPARLPTASPAAPGSCGDPRASLRPDGALPAPGQMPPGSAMARIVQKKRLVVGVSQSGYLLGYRDPATGELTGFEIDLAREIARALFGNDKAIQFRAINAADRIPMLQNGQVDVVVRSFTMTCERWKDISFSTEYYSGGQRVLVPRDSKVRGIDDLGGKKVCAATGSTNINAIAAARSKPIPVSVVDTSDCLVLLQQGQIAAISTDEAILAGYAAQDPNTKVVGPAFVAAPYGVGVSQKSPDLVRFINGVLERMRADGTWARIYGTWLQKSLGAVPAPPAARYRG